MPPAPGTTRRRSGGTSRRPVAPVRRGVLSIRRLVRTVRRLASTPRRTGHPSGGRPLPGGDTGGMMRREVASRTAEAGAESGRFSSSGYGRDSRRRDSVRGWEACGVMRRKKASRWRGRVPARRHGTKKRPPPDVGGGLLACGRLSLPRSGEVRTSGAYFT